MTMHYSRRELEIMLDRATDPAQVAELKRMLREMKYQ